MMKVTIRVAGEVLRALETAGLTPSDYGFVSHPTQQAAVEVDIHSDMVSFTAPVWGCSHTPRHPDSVAGRVACLIPGGEKLDVREFSQAPEDRADWPLRRGAVEAEVPGCNHEPPHRGDTVRECTDQELRVLGRRPGTGELNPEAEAQAKLGDRS